MSYVLSTVIVSLIIVSILRYLNLKEEFSFIILVILAIASPYAIDSFYCHWLSLGCTADALDGIGFIVRAVIVLLVTIALDFLVKKIAKFKAKENDSMTLDS